MSSKEFLDRYLGMIIGVVVALLLIAFGLIDVLVSISAIVFAGWLGRYVQQNKDVVKQKLKDLIDKF